MSVNPEEILKAKKDEYEKQVAKFAAARQAGETIIYDTNLNRISGFMQAGQKLPKGLVNTKARNKQELKSWLLTRATEVLVKGGFTKDQAASLAEAVSIFK